MDGQQTTGAIVTRIREQVLIECEKNPELYHEIDVKRVGSDDWQIERFVIEHQNEETAFKELIRAMKWKKSFGVHDRTDQYFPKEYYEFSETVRYGRDKSGRLVQWEKMKHQRKYPEMNLLTKQFIAHIMEKNDLEESRNGFIVISDSNGSGLSNVNMEILKFKIEITAYYPEAMKLNLIIDLPWVLSSVAKLVLSFCGPKLKERIRFISRKELSDFIDIELIPIELDGKREPKFISPEGSLTLKQRPEFGISDKVIEKYYKSFDKVF